MRRVMVTPTFAAGLGVVIAAVLVYPTSRMVFSYGARCQVPGCGSGAGGPGPGSSAQPGQQMGAGANRAAQPPASGSSSTDGRYPPGQPTLDYQTLSQEGGSFTGQIVIGFQTRSVPAKWELWISYSSARIVSVSGGTWRADTDHSGVVSGSGPNGYGAQLKVAFTVDSANPGGRPSGCSFNGKTCRFVGSSAAGSTHVVSASLLEPGNAGSGASKTTDDGDRGGHQDGAPPRHRKSG